MFVHSCMQWKYKPKKSWKSLLYAEVRLILTYSLGDEKQSNHHLPFYPRHIINMTKGKNFVMQWIGRCHQSKGLVKMVILYMFSVMLSGCNVIYLSYQQFREIWMLLGWNISFLLYTPSIIWYLRDRDFILAVENLLWPQKWYSHHHISWQSTFILGTYA